MPVELEEYVRPGCTILTAFIAMPKPMWIKLFKEPVPCIKDLISPHESILFGRGTLLVYLNDMVYCVTKDANSVVKIEMKDRAPKLHYIYPTCFEAGKPMEFVACGSDLLQPKFRFLVSFAGRYLSSNISITSERCEKGGAKSSDHQLLKIRVPQTKMNLLGPAFIEVENESGLSNFIPILVGDREICEEMEVLLQKFDATLSSKEQQLSCLGLDCEVLASRQTQFSEFVLDVAWLLRNPISGQPSTPSSVLRFNHLLEFLIEKESCVILERVFCPLKSVLDNNSVTGISDADMSLLQKNMDTAQNVLDLKLQENDFLVTPTSDGTLYSQSSQYHSRLVVPATNQVVHRAVENVHGLTGISPSPDEGASVPLLNRDVVMNVNLQERPRKSCSRLANFVPRRPLIMAVVSIGVCLGVCVVVLHHRRRVIQIATTVRLCLLDGLNISLTT